MPLALPQDNDSYILIHIIKQPTWHLNIEGHFFWNILRSIWVTLSGSFRAISFSPLFGERGENICKNYLTQPCCMIYKCRYTQSHTPTYQKRKFKWTDESIKQLSMQCHVRAVCSRLVLIGIEWSRVFYGCLVVRQRNRNRLQLWTQVGGCSQQQWEQSELWHRCSKMRVFQAIFYTAWLGEEVFYPVVNSAMIVVSAGL